VHSRYTQWARTARQSFEAPAAKLLQPQQAKQDLGGGSRAPARFALLAALGEFLPDEQPESFVCQRLIGRPHPRFPPILGHLREEAIGKAALPAASGDHGSCSLRLESLRSTRNKNGLISRMASKLCLHWR
jgi:hypothetical protein